MELSRRPDWLPIRLGMIRRGIMRRLLSEEQGVALVLAIVTMTVLSTLTASVLFSVSLNQRTSLQATESTKAFALAEEGIAYAEGRLYTATSPGLATDVPSTGPLSQDGGTITYSGSLSGSTWTLTAIGIYGGVKRTVQVQAAQPSALLTSNTAAWNYFFVEGGPTCMTLAGNGAVNIPIYTHHDLCINGNGIFTGSDLEVGGALTLIGNATIGKSGQPISKLNVVGACSPAVGCANDTSPFFVSPPGVGHTIPTVTKPVVDFPSLYASTNPGPAAGHGCGAGSHGVPANFFDNDTTMNDSDGNINLFPSSNYDCKGTSGEIKWTAATNTLEFDTVGPNDAQFYFDGSLALSGNTTVIYKGRGQLFFTGGVSMAGQFNLCGITGCTNLWDNNANQLFLFADCWKDAVGDQLNVANGDAYCFDLSGQNTLQADAWVATDYHSGGQANDTGPVITTTAAIAGNPVQLIPLHNAPADLPGSTISTPQPAGAPYNWSG